MFHPTGNAGGFVSGANTQAKGAFFTGRRQYDLPYIGLYAPSIGATSTRMRILASRTSTLTAGRIRRDHPPESFSDSDRGVPGRQGVLPARAL